MTTTANQAFASATELVAAIKTGQIGSRELLEFYFERIDAHNPVLYAVVFEDREAARQRADEADSARAAGEDWGALHGLPMTVKDSYDVAGMPTTWGSPEWKNNFPKQDALSDPTRFGNLIRLPLGKHRDTGSRSFFMDWRNRTVPAFDLHKIDALEAMQQVADALGVEA